MNSFSKYLFEHLHFGLEEKDFTLIEKIIFFLIILNCVFVVIESEQLIYEQYSQLFDSAKLFFGIIFLIEYICRLIAVDQIDNPAVSGLKCNVSDVHSVESAINLSKDILGSIDIVVNNTGISGPNVTSWEYPIKS